MTDDAPNQMPDDSQAESPLASATAPGKIILLGEHAVVYGVPALAVPMNAVEATVTVWQADHPLAIHSRLPAGDPSEVLSIEVADAPADDPLATAVRAALAHAGTDPAEAPDWLVEIASTVPLGAGMGSSAAVAVALVRAVASAAGAELDDEAASRLAFEAETCTHGTPSGIDNTVVAHDRPILFSDGGAEVLDVAVPITLVVADTGVPGPTAEAVAGVSQRRQERPSAYSAWFGDIGRYVEQGARAIATGELVRLGWLLNSNHLVLQAMRVSSAELNALVAGARRAGAMGAKLSGAGRGGVAVALAADETADDVADGMRESGAVHTWRTRIPSSDE